MTLLATLALLAALAPSAAGTPIQAGKPAHRDRFGIKLLDAPVSRRKDPRARVGIVDHLKPGTVITRRIQVNNVSPKTHAIDVYPAAATIQHHALVPAPDRTPNELTSWVSTEHNRVQVPPWGQANVRVMIRVPRLASRGERYAIVWAQESAPPTAHRNLGMVNRVGIPIYLDIGPGGEPPSDMSIQSLTPERARNGRPQVIAQVRNTGERALTISGKLWLSDGPGGLRAGPYPATLGVTLAPGDVAPVTVVLDPRLPNGPWKARMVLQSGLVVKTATAKITFPVTGIGVSVALASAPRYGVPIGIALVLAVAGGLFLVWRRRHRWVTTIRAR